MSIRAVYGMMGEMMTRANSDTGKPSPALAHIPVPILYCFRGRPYSNVNQLARLLARGVLDAAQVIEVEKILQNALIRQNSRNDRREWCNHDGILERIDE